MQLAGEQMPFPFTIDGRIDLSVACPTADHGKRILTRMEKLIAGLEPRHLQCDSNEIKFYGNILSLNQELAIARLRSHERPS